METSGTPLETETKPDRRALSRSMLGRIRQATSDFDFTALLSGTKTESAPADLPREQAALRSAPLDIPAPLDLTRESPTKPCSAPPSAPDPIAYNPFLIDEPEPPAAMTPATEVERAPEPAPTARNAAGPIQFNSSFSQPALPAARPLAATPEPTAPPVRATPVANVYARPAASLPATMTRLRLYLCAIALGGVLGGGLGAILEWLTPVRIISMAAVYAPPALPAASQSTDANRIRISRRSARKSARASQPVAPKPIMAAPVLTSSKPPDSLETYRRYLLVPGAMLLLAGLFWICGGPEALGEFEDAGYWGAAAASLALAVLCGLLATMVTLDLRAAHLGQPAPHTKSVHTVAPKSSN